MMTGTARMRRKPPRAARDKTPVSAKANLKAISSPSGSVRVAVVWVDVMLVAVRVLVVTVLDVVDVLVPVPVLLLVLVAVRVRVVTVPDVVSVLVLVPVLLLVPVAVRVLVVRVIVLEVVVVDVAHEYMVESAPEVARAKYWTPSIENASHWRATEAGMPCSSTK